MFFLHLGHRGRQECRQLRWGDITVGEDEHGRYLAFKERTTKTRQGVSNEARVAPPKAYQNDDDPKRCPIKLYELYTKCRPQSMFGDDTPFYLSINNMIKDKSNHKAWFKCSAMGKNSLGNLMKGMVLEAGVSGRFTNHTARKTSITNLLQAGVPPTAIKHISGHKSEASIGHYASVSKAQVKHMNNILLNPSKYLSETGGNSFQKAQNVIPIPTSSEEKNGSSLVPTQRVPLANITDAANNQTAVSGLLPHANLSNCTFNISYAISNNNKN